MVLILALFILIPAHSVWVRILNRKIPVLKKQNFRAHHCASNPESVDFKEELMCYPGSYRLLRWKRNVTTLIFLQPPWEGSPSRTISRKIKCDEEPREMLLISLVDMVETWGELG